MNRDELRRKGQDLRGKLGLTSSKTARRIGFETFMTDFVYGAIWAREGLGEPERALCSLSASFVLGRQEELRQMIPAALDAGLAPRSLPEVFVHAGIYAGFGATEIALEMVDRIYEERGIELPEEPPQHESIETLEVRGEAFIEEVHGDRGKQGYASPENPVTYELYAFATRYAYGDIWLREGLSLRERFLCALTCFASLGLETQLRKFSLSALRVGLSSEEIREALIQTTPYAGLARALNALAIFSSVTSEK